MVALTAAYAAARARSDPLDTEAALAAAGLPAPVLHLSRDDIPGMPALPEQRTPSPQP